MKSGVLLSSNLPSIIMDRSKSPSRATPTPHPHPPQSPDVRFIIAWETMKFFRKRKRARNRPKWSLNAQFASGFFFTNVSSPSSESSFKLLYYRCFYPRHKRKYRHIIVNN